LFTIARRRTVDAQRARHRRPTVLVDLREEFSHRGAHEPAAEETALDGLSTRSALAIIAALPVDQAEAVALSVIGGLTAAEIAEIVGVSAGVCSAASHWCAPSRRWPCRRPGLPPPGAAPSPCPR
jgi:DNA-directed RNA polymerase specialized sigma24 family protein